MGNSPSHSPAESKHLPADAVHASFRIRVPTAASARNNNVPAVGVNRRQAADLGKELFRNATQSTDDADGDDVSPSPQPQDVLMEVECADCNEDSGVSWVSMEYGTSVCALCAGAHRALGTTTVRSRRLDTWTPAQVDAVLALGGNAAINDRLEFHVPTGVYKPDASSSGDERRAYIRAKYVDGAFGTRPGFERLKPKFADKSGLRKTRLGSYLEGKREFVGIVNVAWLATQHVTRPRFMSRHLSGGYYFVCSVNHGSFIAKSLASVHAEFTGQPPTKLSWDGCSDLSMELHLGSKVLGYAAPVQLGFLLDKPSGSKVVMDFLSKRSGHLVGRFVFKLSFIDLR